MDEATSEGRSTVSGATEPGGHEPTEVSSGDVQQKSPEELRAEIEQTRHELGDTVEALAEKTDVKARAKDRVAAVKDGAAQKKDEFVARAKDATPDSAGAGAQQVTSTIQGKPTPFAAAGAFAAGLLIGWLLGRR
jgi:ElaB/YqjD/DUF883 family membrane-anchored ribosome-binding protein